MKLTLRPRVQRDLEEAGRWYEARQPGLQDRFLGEIESVLSRIQENPQAYPLIHLDLRRAPLRRFPYGVYYALIEDVIQVVAVVHDARHPSVWRHRR